jgi:hypothetical protein
MLKSSDWVEQGRWRSFPKLRKIDFKLIRLFTHEVNYYYIYYSSVVLLSICALFCLVVWYLEAIYPLLSKYVNQL